MSEQRFIYGLYDRRERCRYVGQTKDPKQREYSHRWRKLVFIVLIVCDKENGPWLERDLIRALDKVGQCDLNKMHSRRRRRNYPKRINTTPHLGPYPVTP